MLTRTILTAALSLALGGCDSLTVTTSDAAICEAMRPSFPIKFHGNTDSADTIKEIRQANARFAAACR